jgi:hypothetical protein
MINQSENVMEILFGIDHANRKYSFEKSIELIEEKHIEWLKAKASNEQIGDNDFLNSYLTLSFIDGIISLSIKPELLNEIKWECELAFKTAFES